MNRCWRPWEPCDYTLEAAMSSYWANFAKTGDPNGEDLPTWQPYTAEHPVRMLLAEEIKEENAIAVEDYTDANPASYKQKFKFLLK